MKKTMLTYKTLDRFESENITENYTAQELERVEFAAYVANMNACAHAEWTEADIYADFLRVLDIDKITVTPKTIEEEQEEQTMTIYEIRITPITSSSRPLTSTTSSAASAATAISRPI